MSKLKESIAQPLRIYKRMPNLTREPETIEYHYATMKEALKFRVPEEYKKAYSLVEGILSKVKTSNLRAIRKFIKGYRQNPAIESYYRIIQLKV